MIANQMNWKLANRYSFNLPFPFSRFPFEWLEIWLGNFFPFSRRNHWSSKASKNTKLRWDCVVWHILRLCSYCCQTFKKRTNVIPSLSWQSKAMHLECEDPPGATSSEYLSEAAKVSSNLSKQKMCKMFEFKTLSKCGKFWLQPVWAKITKLCNNMFSVFL